VVQQHLKTLRGSPAHLIILALIVAGTVTAAFGSGIHAQPALNPGGLTALPPVTLGGNVLQNPGFETVTDDVPDHWVVASGYSSDSTSTRPGSAGRKSLRWNNTGADAHQTVALTKGTYDFSAWVKTSGVTVGGPGLRLTVDLRPTLHAWYPSEPIDGTRDWRLYQLNNLVIPDDMSVTVRLENYGGASGMAWFDDVQLVRRQDPPVSAFMLYPNYRGMIFDDHQPRTMRFDVTVGAGPSDPTPYTVTATVKEESSNATVHTERFVNARRHFVAAIDASYMLAVSSEHPQRAYRVTFSIDTGAIYSYPDFRVSLVPGGARAQMNTAFDDRNNVLIRGEPKFILGVYDSGGSYSTDPDHWNTYLWSSTGERRMAELPINMYLNYTFGLMPADATAALLDSLREHGAGYLQTGNCVLTSAAGDDFQINASDAYVRTNDTYVGPGHGLSGFYTTDECMPDLMAGAFTRNLRLRSLAPDTITLGTQIGDITLPVWRDAVDVLAADPYPLYGAEADQLFQQYNHADVADQAALTRKTVLDARPFFTVLQFFKATDNGRWPTLSEMRSHAYMAIVEGAKGLFWWSLGDQSGGDLGAWCAWQDNGGCSSLASDDPRRNRTPSRDALMAQLVSVVSELAGTLRGADPHMPEVLVASDAPSATLTGNSNSAIKTKVKIFAGKGYVFAYNYLGKSADNPTGTQTVTFTWNTAPGRVTVNAEDRAIITSGNHFSDSFGPYEAHVYVIENGERP